MTAALKKDPPGEWGPSHLVKGVTDHMSWWCRLRVPALAMQLSQRRREERTTESPDGWPSPMKSLQARGQGGGSQRRP